MDAVCRDCSVHHAGFAGDRCPSCGSRRIVKHAELGTLSIAHIDCDAFYAAIEKRDRPDLSDRPVIVGGGTRGVVAACCYVARLHGVRSAMPMFKALRACPEAVVIRPDMAKYSAAGRQVRALMRSVSRRVEPLSIDEAFLDLGADHAEAGPIPAQRLADLAMRIERDVGITVSVGLAPNKFLAKIASDLDKPRGFRVIGRGDSKAFLSPQPVSLIWGVGPSLCRRLNADGLYRIGDVAALTELELTARYGAMGRRLYRFARGDDDRIVSGARDSKSVSAETTFETDIDDLGVLTVLLGPLCETVARRLTESGLAGHAVVLKLKTVAFRVVTRRVTLMHPTQRSRVLHEAACHLLKAEPTRTAYRLIGVGAAELVSSIYADPPSLFEHPTPSMDEGSVAETTTQSESDASHHPGGGGTAQ